MRQSVHFQCCFYMQSSGGKRERDGRYISNEELGQRSVENDDYEHIKRKA